MWRTIYRDKLALVSFALLIMIIAVIYTWVFIDPFIYPFIDSTIRDIINQLTLNAGVSFFITFVVSFFGMIIGTLYGIMAGFSGKFINYTLTRILKIFAIIPVIMLAAVLMAVTSEFFPAYSVVVYAFLMVTFVSWQSTARLVCAKTMEQKALGYVLASKTLGTPGIAIIFKGILPNLKLVIISHFMIRLVVNMGIEIGLTYLGIGMPSEIPSLGRGGASATYIMLDYLPCLLLPSAALIAVVMVCMYFISRAFRKVQRLTGKC